MNTSLKRTNCDIVESALDWSLRHQSGKHPLNTSDINNIFGGGNTKIGRSLRKLLIRTDDFRGSKHKKSRYCVNLFELRRMYEDFFNVTPKLISKEQMCYEQVTSFMSEDEFRQLMVQQLRQKQKNIVMSLVKESGLTPTELVRLINSHAKLSGDTVEYLLLPEDGRIAARN